MMSQIYNLGGINIMGDERDYLVGKQLDDHEQRLRKLEESDIKQQIQLAEIQKSQSDLKALVMETSKEQSKANDKLLNALLNNNNVNNKIRLQDRKEFWGIVACIATALGAYLLKLAQ